MIKKPLVIAIDGPAASGKGTLARQIAAHFGLAYLDTGSLYRAVGYKIISSGHDPEDKNIAIEIAKNISENDAKNPHLYDEGVGSAASIVSAIPEVREALLSFQRAFAANPEGAILDGRDIGTVICPDADFKFYITADLPTRAERRFKQLQNNGNSIIYQSVLADLQRRDDRDSKRTIAPLIKAEDAVAIDTTNIGVEETLRYMIDIIKGKRKSAVL